MDLKVITGLSDHFKMIDAEIQRMENYKIETVLKYLGVPDKGENLISIEECLKWDCIVIYLPTYIFKDINFDSMNMPKKMMFLCNSGGDGILISKSIEYIPINRLEYLHGFRGAISESLDQEILNKNKP